MLIFQKNSLFYEAERVSIPQVRYYIIPSPQVALAMYKQNELDVLGGVYTNIPVEQLANIKTDPFVKQEFHSAPDLCVTAYGFQTQQPPVDNRLVRKALIASLDRELLVKLITRGDEEPAKTLIPSRAFSNVDSPETQGGIDFDPAQAATWLAEAGYPNAAGLPELSLLYADEPGAGEVAASLRDSFSYYLNLPVKLRGAPSHEFPDVRDSADALHLFSIHWCAAAPNAENILENILNPEKAFQPVGWNYRELSQVMKTLASTTDPIQRRLLYRRAQQILCEEEAVIIPLYFSTASMLVKSRVKDWYYRAIGGQRIRDWSLED